MKAKTRKWIQIFLAVLLAASVLRVVIIHMGRRSASQPAQQRTADTGLDPDYYVTPKKLYLYDTASAKQNLSGRRVWIREGYRYPHFPLDRGKRRVDFKQEAGYFLSLEPVQIQDVMETPPPTSDDQPQIVAIFDKDGSPYAFSIGARQGKNYTIRADQMFFYDDPRELYKHWSKEMWDAIDRHEVKPGMNELQTSFAIGMGLPQRSSNQSVRTVVYPRGGNETTVTFVNGKVTDIKQRTAGRS